MNVRRATQALLLCVLMPVLSNCMMFHKTSPGFHPVWTPKHPVNSSNWWPAKSLAVPAGFTITPYQAFEITADSGLRSRKHVWHLYTDSRYYYVHDTFLGDSPKEAHKYGLRIHGKTGKIEKSMPR